MSKVKVSWIGLEELRRAIKRNPQKVLDEARLFLSRGLAAYKRGIIRSPWKVGGIGGGSPKKTGNLRDKHFTTIRGLQGIIGPNLKDTPYAKYVHGGTRRMKARPWLDYVKSTKQREIQTLYRGMLTNITKDLAK